MESDIKNNGMSLCPKCFLMLFPHKELFLQTVFPHKIKRKKKKGGTGSNRKLDLNLIRSKESYAILFKLSRRKTAQPH